MLLHLTVTWGAFKVTNYNVDQPNTDPTLTETYLYVPVDSVITWTYFLP